MNYKVGQILKVKKGHDKQCANYQNKGGSFIKITGIKDGFYEYDILDVNKKRISQCNICFADEDLEPSEKTLENLEVGDILVDCDGEKKVLGICGLVYFLSEYGNFDRCGLVGWTLESIKEEGLKLKGESGPKEMTVKEISDKLGYEVKVVK